MAENVSSSVLFHFTPSIDRLKGILKSGFFPRYCLEYGFGPDDIRAIRKHRPPMYATPMVCFCDIPVSLFQNHVKDYGPYGIGLSKEWGIKNRLAPVLYTHRKAPTCRAVSHPAPAAGKIVCDGLAKDLKVLTAFTKRRVGPAWRQKKRPKFREGVEFYDEREWRYVPGVPGPELFLPRQYLKDISKLNALRKDLKRFALQAEPDYIMYLILPPDRSENNVLDLARYLRGLYKPRDATLVTTTIMTLDRIKEDV